MTFEDLNLSEPVLRSIKEMGYEKPTEIQEKSIPVLLSGTKDYVGLAQTGTGKTAAFSLPLLHLIEKNRNYPQALILSPTRELCIQIHNEIEIFSKYEKGIKPVAVYGGTDIVRQIKDIKKGVQIVVATPGRLLDLAKRGAINLSEIDYVVLDEADEMLNMGFKDDLDEILTYASNVQATWLFSATMPSEVRRIASNYMTDPYEVTIGTKNSANTNIEHAYYVTEHRNRMPVLQRVIDYYPNIYGIVFCRTRQETKEVAESLMKNGYNADALHGDLSQAQRDYVMKKFKSHNLNILVATDVAARGIDVDDISHVINYNLPDENEVYTHRSGRTARAGKKGKSIMILGPRDVRKVKTLEKLTNQKFKHEQIPDAVDICENQLVNYADAIKNVKYSPELEKYFPKFIEELKDISKEELLQNIAAINFQRMLTYYEKSKDLNYTGKTDDGNSKGSKARENGGERFFITVGKRDGFTVTDLITLLSEQAGINAKDIGQIDLKENFSFFEVEKNAVDGILKSVQTGLFDGERKLKVEVAGGTSDSQSSKSRGGRGGRDRERSRDRDNRGSGRDSKEKSRQRHGGGSRIGNSAGTRRERRRRR